MAFDNEYFVNLVERTWKPRKWDGNFQFEGTARVPPRPPAPSPASPLSPVTPHTDDESGKLMMLPTDIALVTDPKFRPYVELYAKSQVGAHACHSLAHLSSQ